MNGMDANPMKRPSDSASLATGVLLKLAPAVAIGATSMDLTIAREAIAELLPEERETLSRLVSGGKNGITAGGVFGGVVAAAAKDPWLVPIGAVVGAFTGPFVAEACHDRPLVRRMTKRLVQFVRRFSARL